MRVVFDLHGYGMCQNARGSSEHNLFKNAKGRLYYLYPVPSFCREAWQLNRRVILSEAGSIGGCKYKIRVT